MYMEFRPQEPLLISVISSQSSQESRVVGAAGTLTSSKSSCETALIVKATVQSYYSELA